LIFPRRLRWVWLSLAIVFLDRATKAWIESQTANSWRREVIHNFFYLVHSSNPGIAFSFLANSSSPFLRIGLIVGAIAIIAVIAWLLIASKQLSTLSAVGLAMVLGGATGNVTDRILHGAVTDFIELIFGSYHYPAFNVADSAITVGAILLVIDVLFSRQPRPNSK
jgi:signal peptidase II